MNQIRDSIKDAEFFSQSISEREDSHSRRLKKFLDGAIAYDREQAVKVDMSKNLLYKIIAKYSAGHSWNSFFDEFKAVVDLFSQSWGGYWKLKNSKGVELNQYTLSAYDEMLWMLSLGYLLNISDDDFKKLVDVIDRDQVVDKLFEFIICAKLVDRPRMLNESYSEFFGVPKVFESLRCAIEASDKKKSEKCVSDFITKYWYKNHKDAGWYDSHKSKHNTYFGYWSFETAAVVKIMGLDDSSFRDCQYYPKDLVV